MLIRINPKLKKALLVSIEAPVHAYIGQDPRLPSPAEQKTASCTLAMCLTHPSKYVDESSGAVSPALELNWEIISCAAVALSSSVEPGVPYHGLLSNAEKDDIDGKFGRLYLGCWQDDILRLRAIITEKTWVGFDLDDTLHEFRSSSGMATNKALEEISKQYATPISALKDEYPRVLKTKTANAFSDGKTSFDYRKRKVRLGSSPFRSTAGQSLNG